MNKVKKAFDVIRGTVNPIIISDMVRVLEIEFSHMETLIDTQENHVQELLSDNAEYRTSILDEAIEAVDKNMSQSPELMQAIEILEKLKENK